MANADLDLYDSLGGTQTPVATPKKGGADTALYDQIEAGHVQQVDPVAERSAGRQALSPGMYSDQLNSSNPVDRAMGVVGSSNIPNQAIESGEANALDTFLPGNKAKNSMDPNTPMEMGDVLAARGFSPANAALTGTIASVIGNPLNIGHVAGLGVDAVGKLIGKGAKKAIPGITEAAGGSFFNKNAAKMRHLAANPGALTDENMKNAPAVASQIGRDIATDIHKVKKIAGDTWKAASKDAPLTPVPVSSTQKLAEDARGILGEDIPHSEGLLQTVVTHEPVNSNTYAQTDRYILPQTEDTGILDENGQAIMRTIEGKHTSKGVVSVNEGGNVQKETQIRKMDALGNAKVVGVEKHQATSDKTQMQPVTLRDMLTRMAQGTPMTAADLSGVRTTLQGLRQTSSIAGRISDNIMEELGNVDERFLKAREASRDLYSLEDNAKTLFGGIQTDMNPSIPAADRVKMVKGGEARLLNYLNSETPQSAERQSAPIIDSILSKYGDPANYTKKISDVSAAEGMHSIKPTGGFAVSGAARAYAPAAVGALSAGAGGGLAYASHPVVGGAAALAVLAMSAPLTNTKLIQMLKAKKVLPSNFTKLVGSPAAQYLKNSVNPATLISAAGLKGAVPQQGQSSDEL